MRVLRAVTWILITLVMFVGIGTSLKLMLEREKLKPLTATQRLKMNEQANSDRDERLHLERVSRAYSRYVSASASTTTTTQAPPPSKPRPKSQSQKTTAQSKATVSRAEIPGGDIWAKLAKCESGGNPLSRSANGRYTGAFQFAAATWQSLGYSGVAADYPYETQLAAAQKLQARSGWGQWPRCSKQLGLT